MGAFTFPHFQGINKLLGIFLVIKSPKPNQYLTAKVHWSPTMSQEFLPSAFVWRALQHHFDGVLLLRCCLWGHHSLHTRPAGRIDMADTGNLIDHLISSVHQSVPLSQMVLGTAFVVPITRRQRQRQRWSEQNFVDNDAHDGHGGAVALLQTLHPRRFRYRRARRARCVYATTSARLHRSSTRNQNTGIFVKQNGNRVCCTENQPFFPGVFNSGFNPATMRKKKKPNTFNTLVRSCRSYFEQTYISLIQLTSFEL